MDSRSPFVERNLGKLLFGYKRNLTLNYIWVRKLYFPRSPISATPADGWSTAAPCRQPASLGNP